MALTTEYGRGNPRLPVDLLALMGFSTVGKSTLITALGAHYHFHELSAGHMNKERVNTMGVAWADLTGNGPGRNRPHPALPRNPATGQRYTPREMEIATHDSFGSVEIARLNRLALEQLYAQRLPVIFNGFRSMKQYQMLCDLRANWLPQGGRVRFIRIVSPQVTQPPPHAKHDDLLVQVPVDGEIWNDHTVPPQAMVTQLQALLAQ